MRRKMLSTILLALVLLMSIGMAVPKVILALKGGKRTERRKEE